MHHEAEPYPKLHVLVTGATGFIGSRIVRALAARGHHVTACVRNPATRVLPEGVRPMACDFTADRAPEIWRPRLVGIDVVVNAVGIIAETGAQRFAYLHQQTPVALFAACEQAGVRRVIQISALGADADAASAYHLTKRAADDDLAARPLDWTILRPSLVAGAGGGSDTLFRALAALPVTPLIGDGAQRIRPVHVDDLVRAVVACIEEQKAVRQRVDLVGADELTFADYLGRLRAWLGLGRLHALQFPTGAARRLAALAGPVAPGPFNADAVTMLLRGNTASLEPVVKLLGFRPAGATGWLARQPATEAERWHARLILLRPLLRFAIGFVWVWAGIASAWLWPREASHAMLAAVGLTGAAADLALWSGAALDLLLGLALWAGWRVRAVARAQIGTMLGYTAIISLWLPQWWLHPFGAVAKNVPLLVATLVLLAMEDRKP